ncbi:monovalent cation:proton antiporter-2 (CPA2) family protein [Neisseriaceae bacterium TC5R-5]|nr:monovalent cation:proton antiporter-2 (CPA2) family protein [Neisseriaceae bacterium TC5R-5]
MLTQVVFLLAAAVIVVPVLQRFGLASVLGFLVAGIVIGPWGLGLVNDTAAVLHATEFGVVLLMFVIGLELQPSRLWVLRHAVFGVGGAQLFLTALLLGGVAYLSGVSPQASLIIGLGLGLSSTAFVLQMLAEKRQLTARHGHSAFAVLLFQDLTVIPLLALIPLLSPIHIGAARPPVWVSLAVLLLVVLGGRFLLRPAFRLIAKAHSNELFTMATLLVVTGTALLLEKAGLSMSLGAFLAGVLLADSEFRHEIEADINPFKGVLLGLFFVAVGMSANLGLLVDRPLLIIELALGLMLIKAVVLYGIGRVSGLNGQASRRFAVYLCQGGEFAFVLFAQASAGQLIPVALADLLSLTVTVSMALTPFMVIMHERWVVPYLEPQLTPEFDEIEQRDYPVIVAGFGRFGQIITRLLRLRKIPVTVLEINAEQVDFVRRFGNKVYYGDASRLDLLRAAGAERAKILVLAIDDVEASIRTAATVRRHFPQLMIYARARNRLHYYKLKDLGVNVAVRETFAASVALGVEVLNGVGFTRTEAENIATLFVEHDEKILEQQLAVHHDEEQLIQTSKDAMKELEELFETDQATDKVSL